VVYLVIKLVIIHIYQYTGRHNVAILIVVDLDYHTGGDHYMSIITICDMFDRRCYHLSAKRIGII